MAASISKGSKPDKLMRDAIMLALHRETKAKGESTKYLNIIASKLVQLASEGDLGAIKEIGDRVDGKPAQAISVGGDEDNPIRTVNEVLLRGIRAEPS